MADYTDYQYLQQAERIGDAEHLPNIGLLDILGGLSALQSFALGALAVFALIGLWTVIKVVRGALRKGAL